MPGEPVYVVRSLLTVNFMDIDLDAWKKHARDAQSQQVVQTGSKFLFSLQPNPVRIGSTKYSRKWRYKMTKMK